ncbi:MAG: hypothetical protein LC730_02680 [Acidobacteria bacterium]|nr:hypothetical protein [Acidobacteriota bacterium]
MVTKRLLTVIFSIIVLLALSPAALACACCAETGHYSIWTGKPDKYYTGLLDEMKFDQKAFLYMTEADFEVIKGLNEIKKDYESQSWVATAGEFDLVNVFTARTWKFTLKTKSGKTGVLTLPRPPKMLIFKVDIHDGSDQGLGPSLYKEFRFKGNVAGGTGFFRRGIVKPTSYFLVFQGRGNGCDNAADFTHWRLELDGPKAEYAFFGKMKP